MLPIPWFNERGTLLNEKYVIEWRFRPKTLGSNAKTQMAHFLKNETIVIGLCLHQTKESYVDYYPKFRYKFKYKVHRP